MTSVFPGDCLVCGGPLLFALHNSAVCKVCASRIVPQRGLLCGRCGEAIGMESERYAASLRAEVVCAECRMVPPGFVRAAAFGVYEGELREMTHLLKYEGVRSLAALLGEKLAETIEGLPLEENVLMVAVPLFPAKERVRGYNQAVLLGNAAARTLHAKQKMETAHGCLKRVRDTESQFALSPKGRRLNLRGAFRAADVQRLAGRKVLLVDDIYTTGATARECARVLLRAGAAEVWVATLARAQREQITMWDGSMGAQIMFNQNVQRGRNG